MRIVLANYKTKNKRKLKFSIRTSRHVWGIFWERRKNARHNYGGKSIFGYFKDHRTVEFFTRGYRIQKSWLVTRTIGRWLKNLFFAWPKKVVSIGDLVDEPVAVNAPHGGMAYEQQLADAVYAYAQQVQAQQQQQYHADYVAHFINENGFVPPGGGGGIAP